MTATTPFFERDARKPHPTTQGPVELPILYRDASLFGVFFRADVGRAQDMMKGLPIEPWPVLGKAVVALFVWEYRDSTVGRYNEVGLGIQARRRGSSPSLVKLARDMSAQDDQGIWVVSLPVTTQAAYTAGVELWGYPKYVTDIETSFSSRGARVRLGDELTFSLDALRGPNLPGLPVVTFTGRKGSLLRTSIAVDFEARWGLGGAARIDITGSGKTADAMRSLGLEGQTPLAAFRTDAFRARLPAGVPLGAL